MFLNRQVAGKKPKTMTHPQIKEQIGLMKLAIEIENDINTLERLIKPVDAITYKVMADTLRNNYIDVMQKLFTNLLITSNVV